MLQALGPNYFTKVLQPVNKQILLLEYDYN